jgi:hypothetical protein
MRRAALRPVFESIITTDQEVMTRTRSRSLLRLSGLNICKSLVFQDVTLRIASCCEYFLEALDLID